MDNFITIQPSIDQSKGILWDISEEEEGCVVTPTTTDLFGFVDKNEDLDLLIDSTLAENKVEEDNLLSSSPSPLEKDLFGRRSAKNKSAWKYRPENYGKIYNLLTGVEVPVKKLEGEVMTSASQASYLEQLHACECTEDINFCTANIGKLNLDPKYKRDAIYTAPSDYCLYTTPGEEFQHLTTFDVQSVICAMLNSKVRLLWLIGAESNGKITGCHMSHTERDCLRQGVDFALSTEFVPALDPELVDIRFILIDPVFDPDLYLIEITINTPVVTLYQLSSGRIFYNKGGYPTMMNSMNEARLMLLDRKRAEYCKLEKNGIHSRRVGTLHPCPNRVGPFTFITLAFAGGIILGYSIKRFM